MMITFTHLSALGKHYSILSFTSNDKGGVVKYKV